MAHLNVTFFSPSLFQDGSENGVTKADALVDDENLARSFVSEQTVKGLCQIEWEGGLLTPRVFLSLVAETSA